ncbi:MAG: class I SAM-dependent methyltransferase [Nitrospira sp. CG24A]|nr:MAG: class I SAM-dependent methyltransferase [Nitrospira sp. CG24A]
MMSCALCGTNILSTVSTVDAKSRGNLHVVLCNGCGLIQQDPIPSEQDLHDFYAHHYRADYKKTYTPKPKHIYRAGMAALDRLRFLKRNGLMGGKLLDVGAGGGEFIYLSKRSGYQSVGVEPNIGYSEFARSQYGVDVRTGDVRKVSDTYHVISMFHVLEHLAKPVQVFKTLWALVDAGGYVFIEVPNIHAANASPHNTYFKAHIFYFSSASLIACASPYFEPIKIDESANLRVLFKRKPQESPMSLPVREEIAHTTKRLLKKGWLEYLFIGGGIFKGILKLKRFAQEAHFRHKNAQTILHGIEMRYRPHTNQEW